MTFMILMGIAIVVVLGIIGLAVMPRDETLTIGSALMRGPEVIVEPPPTPPPSPVIVRYVDPFGRGFSDRPLFDLWSSGFRNTIVLDGEQVIAGVDPVVHFVTKEGGAIALK